MFSKFVSLSLYLSLTLTHKYIFAQWIFDLLCNDSDRGFRLRFRDSCLHQNTSKEISNHTRGSEEFTISDKKWVAMAPSSLSFFLMDSPDSER